MGNPIISGGTTTVFVQLEQAGNYAVGNWTQMLWDFMSENIGGSSDLPADAMKIVEPGRYVFAVGAVYRSRGGTRTDDVDIRFKVNGVVTGISQDAVVLEIPDSQDSSFYYREIISGLNKDDLVTAEAYFGGSSMDIKGRDDTVFQMVRID